MDRIRISDNFYLDEFQCGKGLPRLCPHCHGSVVIYPWFLNALQTARSMADVRFRINSGHRCLLHNRDVHAGLMFGKVYSELDPYPQSEVRKHDTSRHLWDAADIRPLTDDVEQKADVYRVIKSVFDKLGWSHYYDDNDFIHVDTRLVTSAYYSQEIG